jgi:hypothetical protein
MATLIRLLVFVDAPYDGERLLHAPGCASSHLHDGAARRNRLRGDYLLTWNRVQGDGP